MHNRAGAAIGLWLLFCPPWALAATERVFAPNQWVQLSVPAGYQGSVRTLFGRDLGETGYGRDWVLFGWRPPVDADDAGAYFTVELDADVTAGQGYWFIHFLPQSVTVSLSELSAVDADDESPACPTARGCLAVPFDAREQGVTWNMLGNPLDSTLALDETLIATEASACASGCSLIAAGSASIFNRDVFRYRDDVSGYEVLSDGDSLQPWDGFWAAALRAAHDNDARWLVPAPDDEPVVKPPVTLGDQPDLAQYTLAFSDEFDGNSLDPERWNTGLLWGPYQRINNEEQLYIDTLGMHADAAYTPFSLDGDGILGITATATGDTVSPPPIPAVGDPAWDRLEYRQTPVDPAYDSADINYLSGIITSYESFRFTHGYAEMRARLPAGKGLWPAFWLLPSHYVEDVPEIDAMEFLGDTPERIYQTYHYFEPRNNWRLVSTESFQTNGLDFSERFHTFGVAWEPRQIIWYVDGRETHRITDEQYDIAGQAMYLIANLAVGGNWPGAPNDNTAFPATFEIDYIRAYRKTLSTPVDLSDYQLMFGDEFSGDTLDASRWNTRFLWGPFNTINDEEQYYVDANGVDRDAGYTPFNVADGYLSITAAPAATAAGGGDGVPREQPPADDEFFRRNPARWFNPDYRLPPYLSGMITSYDAFKFANGYVEMRARVPEGDGLWPALWLLNAYYVGPKPEIDILEVRGEDTSVVRQTYHYFDTDGALQSSPADYTLPTGSMSDGFHTVGMQWQPGRIDWYVDGTRVRTLRDPNVAYQLMYVIANLAVGGNFNTLPVDPSALPAELLIDYIRVYQERGTP